MNIYVPQVRSRAAGSAVIISKAPKKDFASEESQ
jgi:hypothetical protein